MFYRFETTAFEFFARLIPQLLIFFRFETAAFEFSKPD